MFTSVGEHGIIPLLVPGVFPPVVFFPCRHTCSSETRGTISTSLVFVGNVFIPLVSLLFLECKLHCGPCSLALKAGQRLYWQLAIL